jgi:ankyrin repeat protein
MTDIFEDCKPSFHIACKESDLHLIHQLLDEGTNIDVKDMFGRTALHYMAVLGNVDIMKLLITLGANINERSNSLWTPLLYASESGNCNCLKVLLDAGADISILDNDDQSCLHVIAHNSCPTEPDYEVCTQYLLEAGINIDIRDRYNRTAKMVAEQAGNHNIVKIIEEYENIPDVKEPES